MLTINWIKTIYFNFKMLPFNQAVKFPVVFFGRVTFKRLGGKITFIGEIKPGRIGFGQRYEVFTKSRGISEFILDGEIIVKGKAQIGYDYSIYVAENAKLIFGNMSSVASDSKIICTESIELGDFARIGSECKLIDTNFHELIDTKSNEVFSKSNPIRIGNYNFIGTRVLILSKTQTPDYCTIASMSLCNKDYTSFGPNVLLGGIPCELLRTNIKRNWEAEEEMLYDFLKIF